MEVLDLGLTQETSYKLSSIGKRFGAMLIDGILVGIVTVPVMIFNVFDLRTSYIFILFSLAGMLYKPLMEYKYGATLGKMAVSIRVIDYSGAPITFQQAFLRSIFNLISQTLSLITMIMIVSSGLQIDTLQQYSQVLEEQPLNRISQAFNLLILADYIPAFFDKQKRCLHDRIARTLVVLK